MRPLLARRRAVALAAAIPFAWVLVLATGIAEAQSHAGRSPRPYDGDVRVTVIVDPFGFYVGAGLVGVHILDQARGNELIESGSGLTLYGGLRLSQRLAFELGWVATFHRPAHVATDFGSDTDYLVLNGFTADAKIYLGGGHGLLEPYVQGGVGLYMLDSRYVGAQSLGTGFQGGGGFDVHVAAYVDLGARALYRGMSMGPPRSDENDTFVSALAGEANLTLRF